MRRGGGGEGYFHPIEAVVFKVESGDVVARNSEITPPLGHRLQPHVTAPH